MTRAVLTGKPIDWKRDLRQAFGATCYILLRLAGWFAMTLLATFGAGLLFFLMIGDFTAIGFFSQIANLGTHFVAAGAVRRAAFQDQLHAAALIVFTTIGLLRWRGLIAIVNSTKDSHHG
ncbi:MAG: hypothetical protein M3Y22_18245 [Pseudomonadota bacterium]|nr:hypothetical protein [Pseudomonadota bacterium]